ncbi:hypothetical protein Tco_0974837 [Tanacetum coccineum]|uniref:Uncharacterized protein n=1 Tax=Tanacetum coccineum TaxID=301880 RepID=A0ABQ5ECP5_9ASTR
MPCKTGRCAQMAMFVTRFLRYIDTRPNGDALRKCILEGPYTPTIVTTPAVPATENSPAVPEQTTVEQRQLKKCGKPSKVLQQVSLQNNQTEFERYKAFNDRTVDYDKLERKLNETLGLLAQKEIDIKEGLKVKAYKISVVKEKHDELVKQSLLTKSHYEGQQDKNIAISVLKKLIDKCKGKSMDTKFDKPSVVRQPHAQRIPKLSVLGKPAPFSDSLERTNFAKKKSVSKTNESECLSKPVTPQNLPQTATQAIRNTNVIKTRQVI